VGRDVVGRCPNRRQIACPVGRVEAMSQPPRKAIGVLPGPRRTASATLLAVGLWGFGSVQTIAAQPPRTRTLTYEAGRRTWVETPPPPPGTPEGDLYAIQVQVNSKEYKAALSDIKAFTKRHGERGALWPEVLIAQAQALVGRREYEKAHQVLQGFLAEYGGMGLTSEALRLEFVIAEAYLGGAKHKVWGLRLFSGEDLALRILDQIAADYPESELAELATKTKADHLFRTGDHALAQLEYAYIVRDHPESRYHPYALRRSAESTLAVFAGVDYDGAPLVEAEERYGEYASRYPSRADREGVGLIVDGIRQAQAEKEFSIGAYYERTRHWGSAIFYYQNVCESWPETIAAVKATERLELLGAKEATRGREGVGAPGAADQ